MSNREVCDRCLKVNPSSTPYPHLFVRADGDSPNIGSVSIDVCPSCWHVIHNLVMERICTTFTPDDRKEGIYAPKPKTARKRGKGSEPHIMLTPEEQASQNLETIAAFTGPPEGVTVIPLTPDMDMALLHDTIADAVGDSFAESFPEAYAVEAEATIVDDEGDDIEVIG